MKRKLIKRVLTFMMLLALLVSTANPIFTYAEELPENGMKSDTENGGDIENELKSGTETVAVTPGEGDNVEGGDKTDQNNDGQYDVTKPVIEKVEFPQQGTTIKVDETILLYVYAYDTETEEGALDVNATISAVGTNNYGYEEMECSYDEKEKRYVCSYNLDGANVEKIVISSIRVTDKAGNYSDHTCQDEKYEYKYWINTEQQEVKEKHIKKFELKQNGQILNENDNLEMFLELEEEIEDGYSIYVIFENGSSGRGFYLNYGANKKEFDCKTTVGTDYGDGEWILKGISLKKGALGKWTTLQIDHIEECKYTVKKTETEVETEKPVITSVSLDRNGEMLTAGDKAIITVGVDSSNGLYWYGTVEFMATSNISNSMHRVELSYDADAGVYKGVFRVTENTYPCEWYITKINIWDKENNKADSSEFTKGHPYYVNVKNGNTFVNPTYNVNLDFRELNEEGKWISFHRVQNVKAERRQTLKEAGITFPEMNSKYPGVTQIGWEDSSGETITEDMQITGDIGYMTVYAKYDKKCINVSYNYIDTEEKWQALNQRIILETDATYGEAIKEAKKYMPENITKKYKFEQWDTKCDRTEEVIIRSTTIDLTAKYTGKVVIPIKYGNVCDEEGYYLKKQDIRVLLVDEGTIGSQVMAMLDKWEKPKFYPGLRVKGWKYISVSSIDSGGGMELEEDKIIENGQIVVPIASYENCLIQYCIDPRFDPSFEKGEDWIVNGYDHDLEAIFCQVAEIGEKVTFPETFEGYQKITWVDTQYQPGDTFTVKWEGGMSFCGYGTKDSSEPEEPTSPSKPVNPENPITPSNPEAPEQVNPIQEEKLSESAVQGIVNTINGAGTGESIRVDMGNVTIVPKEILEAAKGKDVNIQLNMNGYTWTINGASILANDLKDINLKVIPDTNHIPSKTIQALAGDNPTRQLTLVHEGDFGFKATLTLNMGNEYSGKYGNLYYHDSDGKMVFINAGQISPNGDVSLEFSHASDYVIVMNDKEMSQTDVPTSVAPITNNGQKVNQNKSPKTGDNWMGIVWMLCSFSALGVICSMRRKNQYHV